MAIEATRIAVKYRTPVILLSDGYIANGAFPWLLPDLDAIPDISVPFATEFNHPLEDGPEVFWPFTRDPETLARPWAIPGTPKLMHRIGGIEKEDGTGNISYTPENHERMVGLRAAKVAGIANDIPLATIYGDEDADLIVLGWGSTWGSIKSAVRATRERGDKVGWIHLTHLNPMPPNLGDLLRKAKRVIVPEMNTGQLCSIIRSTYLVDAQPLSKVQGVPFLSSELEAFIKENLS